MKSYSCNLLIASLKELCICRKGSQGRGFAIWVPLTILITLSPWALQIVPKSKLIQRFKLNCVTPFSTFNYTVQTIELVLLYFTVLLSLSLMIMNQIVQYDVRVRGESELSSIYQLSSVLSKSEWNANASQSVDQNHSANVCHG